MWLQNFKEITKKNIDISGRRRCDLRNKLTRLGSTALRIFNLDFLIHSIFQELIIIHYREKSILLKCSFPPGFGEKIENRNKEIFDFMEYTGFKIIAAGGGIRPVYSPGAANDIIPRQRSPTPGIKTVIPVISHAKIMALGHQEGFP